MSNVDDIIAVWQEVSGSVEPPSYYSKSMLERYVPRVVESARFSGVGRSAKDRRRVVDTLWEIRQEPFAIAYAFGAAIRANKTDLAYVIGCLKNAPSSINECPAESIPQPIEKNIEDLTEEELITIELADLSRRFLRSFSDNTKCPSDCPECFGKGIGVIWFGNGGNILGGKFGVCSTCFPGQGPPQGLGLVSSIWLDQEFGVLDEVEEDDNEGSEDEEA